MIKALFDFITKMVGILLYFLGDLAFRRLTGRDEFPKYYWITVGLLIAYQIISDMIEIKNKMEK